MADQSRAARGLAVALVAVVALAAWRDRASLLAAPLRAQEPMSGLLSVRLKGQGRVVPPTLYLVSYGPAAGTLDLVLLPPSARVPGARAPSGRTLAEVYAEAYLPDGDMKRAQERMRQAALKVVQERALPIAALPQAWLELELPYQTQPASPADMKALLLAWARDPLFWLRLPSALGRAVRHGATTLRAYDLILAAWTAERLDPDKIYPARLPEDRAGIFLARAYARALRGPKSGGPTTAEILNASDSDGVAWRATKILRTHGIDVVHFGNAGTKEPAVRFIDRTNRPEAARTVARILGCPDADAVTEMEKNPKADVTLILGQDFPRCSELAPPW